MRREHHANTVHAPTSTEQKTTSGRGDGKVTGGPPHPQRSPMDPREIKEVNDRLYRRLCPEVRQGKAERRKQEARQLNRERAKEYQQVRSPTLCPTMTHTDRCHGVRRYKDCSLPTHRSDTAPLRVTPGAPRGPPQEASPAPILRSSVFVLPVCLCCQCACAASVPVLPVCLCCDTTPTPRATDGP